MGKEAVASCSHISCFINVVSPTHQRRCNHSEEECGIARKKTGRERQIRKEKKNRARACLLCAWHSKEKYCDVKSQKCSFKLPTKRTKRNMKEKSKRLKKRLDFCGRGLNRSPQMENTLLLYVKKSLPLQSAPSSAGAGVGTGLFALNLAYDGSDHGWYKV